MTESRQLDDAELRRRLATLTLERKVRLLTGQDFWSLPAEPSIGLRSIVMSDGPAGVRGRQYDERDPSACLPCPTALGATFDVSILDRVGNLLALECRRKGIDVLLAPTINLQRDPRGGRHFENISEDPVVVGQLGSALVRGVQRGGVAATAKHYVANDSETERFTLNVEIDNAVLRELYLAPFESLVREADVWAVMAAYNSVQGQTMTASDLLREPLKGEWGFSGPVISDWFACRSTDSGGDGLLDIEMPGPEGAWGHRLLEAVTRGDIAESAIDDKVLRVLRLARCVGALDDQESTGTPLPVDESSLLRESSAAGMVLLTNQPPTGGDRPLLPLDKSQIRSVALIGEGGRAIRVLGGGSAIVAPKYVREPLDELARALGSEVEVRWSAGASPAMLPEPIAASMLRCACGLDGVHLTMRDAKGKVLHEEHRAATVFDWMGDPAPGLSLRSVAEIELRASFIPHMSGRHTFAAVGTGQSTVTVGAAQITDTPQKRSSDDPPMDFSPPAAVLLDVELEADVPVELCVLHQLECYPGRTGDAAGALFGLAMRAHPDTDALIDEAATLAAESDIAVVVVGTNQEVESEGFDRRSLRLPGRQDELVEAVAAANPRVVVVVNSGAPVLLPWRDRVAAVVCAWFPGAEGGSALASVLTGELEPTGRLPMTWPDAEPENTTVAPTDGVLRYDEGLLVGYRSPQVVAAAAFAFGHGLGYTQWRLDAAVLDEGQVAVDVSNIGERDGREVVAVWASSDDPARPSSWLAGFEVVQAAPGATVRAQVRLHPRALQRWTGSDWQSLPNIRLAAALLPAGPGGTLRDDTIPIAAGRQTP